MSGIDKRGRGSAKGFGSLARSNGIVESFQGSFGVGSPNRFSFLIVPEKLYVLHAVLEELLEDRVLDVCLICGHSGYL